MLPKSVVESNIKFQIINLQGIVVHEKSNKRVKQQLQTIDVSSFKPGLYVLRVTANGTIRTIKFIKK